MLTSEARKKRKPLAAYSSFRNHIKLRNLKSIFDSKIAYQTGKGIDKISPAKFAKDKHLHCSTIYRKCRNARYRFSPYVQILKAKGKGKAPRVISYPTVRDRIVLHALKEILHDVFPECVVRRLPNNFVKDVCRYALDNYSPELNFLKVDLEDFYGTINHDKLIRILRRRIRSPNILVLIENAIKTPTVPANYRKADLVNKEVSSCGIPQGLAISNILANIYLMDCDKTFETITLKYVRYVDDIFFFTSPDAIDDIRSGIKDELDTLDLQLNDNKEESGSVDDGFQYLGYLFEGQKITVPKLTQERFLRTCANMITTYLYNSDRRIKEFDLSKETVKNAFLEDLNEKITGAISDTKRYGWLFYFLELNDLELLFRMDAIIASFFKRLDDFDNKAPTDLKRLSRAYYEAKHNLRGGYIHDYNQFDSSGKKVVYLRNRGLIDKDSRPKPKEINTLFIRKMRRNLASLEPDIGRIS